ncbi:hypothetical protein F4775DRAFT_541715 [Biscogniauxia sp. FL1348]|nr:hypothetical protein F4775DRAFT_541715 [Biscogniauxia sp. FL1348]
MADMASAPMKILDPNGDLLIIVTAPANAFAVWDESQYDTTSAAEDEEDRVSIVMEETGIFPEERETVASSTDDDDGNAPGSELRMRASSSHLALASQRFGRMLKNAWPDLAVVHEEDGLRHWETEAVDLAAFETVMDIIHGHNRRVPRAVDLEMFAKVAVVVDDLQCHEAVEVIVDMWLSKLEQSVPPQKLPYSRDLVLWILIATVFSRAEIFRSCTYTAIMESTGPMPSLELPIRGKIIDTLESRRLLYLDSIMDILSEVEDRLNGTEYYCCFWCDSVLLGAVIKQMRMKGLLTPRILRLYTGLSISRTMKLVQEFELSRIQGCSNWRKMAKYCYNGIEKGFTELLVDRIQLLKDEIQGIDLKNDLGYT